MNVRTNVRTQVFFAYVRTLRTSDIGQRTLDNGQRTSLKMARTKTESVANAGHWTDNKNTFYGTRCLSALSRCCSLYCYRDIKRKIYPGCKLDLEGYMTSSVGHVTARFTIFDFL